MRSHRSAVFWELAKITIRSPEPTWKYDTRLGGHRTGLTADRLHGAPKYNRANDWDWNDRARDRQVYDYYNEPLWY